MAHSERGDRTASQPQRLRPGPAARGKRAQEGREDPPQAQDDQHRARGRQRPSRAGHHDQARQQSGQHRGQEGRGHRDRRAHRQRQLPPHVRSAADRGVPAGLRALRAPGRGRRARRDGYRRFALVDRQPDQRDRRRHHQDAAHRLPLGLLLAGLRARQRHVSARAGDRPYGEGLAEPDHGQSVRPPVLERERRLLPVLQRRHGLPRRQEQAERRRPDLGDLRCRRGGTRELENGAAARRSRRLFLQRRHHSGAGRAGSRTRTRSRRCPAPCCRKP